MTEWNTLIAEAVDFRRRLHQSPELTWHEEETAATIRRALDTAGIAWRTCANTGTVATLTPRDASGRHVALRSDIDALPITEATGAPWASRIPGHMHACGHDGHTAAMLGAARWLKQHEDALPGKVTFLFQPAEEGGHGARQMIAEGALDGVDVIFGWHNWPAIPFGQAVCPDGIVMCANGTFRIAVDGAGGHASQPEACRDPVIAAAAVTLALQHIVSRRLAPQSPAVVSVTSIDAPSTPTVIPGQATLEGSIRASGTAERDRIFALIDQTARSTAESYGVTASVEVHERYAATVNEAAAAEEFRRALRAEMGAAWQATSLPLPLMASEDFSYYLQQIPGAYAILGAGDGQGHDAPCHSDRYDFNDALIPVAVRLLARLAGADISS